MNHETFEHYLYACTLHMQDFYGMENKIEPMEDPQQDYFLIAASERDNRTTVRFHRRWETCDELHDISIGVSFINYHFHVD